MKIHNIAVAMSTYNGELYIKEQIKINSPQIEEAFCWHIWMNNYNLIMYICGAKEKNTYYIEYKNAKSELRKLMPKVIKHSLLPKKQKIYIFIKTFFPVHFAKRSLKNAKKALLSDTME